MTALAVIPRDLWPVKLSIAAMARVSSRTAAANQAQYHQYAGSRAAALNPNAATPTSSLTVNSQGIIINIFGSNTITLKTRYGYLAYSKLSSRLIAILSIAIISNHVLSCTASQYYELNDPLVCRFAWGRQKFHSLDAK